MGIIFDGKEFAEKVELEIKKKVGQSEKRFKLVTIYDPENQASRVYTNIKAKKAEELGIDFKAITNNQETRYKQIIKDLNEDDSVDGIMVQLPIANSDELINLIDPKKDVDGLRIDSIYTSATVKSVIEILNNIPQLLILNFKFLIKSEIQNNRLNKQLVIVGNRGEVGSRLENILKKQCNLIGMDKDDFNPEVIRQADVVISATGQAGLIKPEMVKEGVICIDVGYPRGDFDPSVTQKASFLTPVPGGVGPVTVAMLFANLVKL